MPSLRSFRVSLAVGLLVVLPGRASSQEAGAASVDLTGKWLFSVTTDAGTGTPTITLTQKGDSLTGHYSSAALGAADFKGTVKDGRFRFVVPVSVQGTSFEVTYEGTIESKDALQGTVTLGDLGSGTFTARRQ